MRLITDWLSAFTSACCRLFDVTPNHLRNGRRGNLPPESGGFANY